MSINEKSEANMKKKLQNIYSTNKKQLGNNNTEGEYGYYIM